MTHGIELDNQYGTLKIPATYFLPHCGQVIIQISELYTDIKVLYS